MFKTPRLLLEVKTVEKWLPYRIYCNFKSIRPLLNALPDIAADKGGLDNVRIKNLRTQDQIATAKLAIDDRRRRG
jgi:hypothetical protein